MEHHIPVLADVSLDYLITNKNGNYFEGTLGFGGHTELILNKISSSGILVSTDVDINAFNFSAEKFKDEKRIRMYNFNFDKIDVITKIESIEGYHGIFADLGVSSYQLDNEDEGFSFRFDAPLDLRMNKEQKIDAKIVVNKFEEEEIANIIYNYGEEKNSRRIAREIVKQREIKKFETTTELAEVIRNITPKNFQNKTLSRVFQAIRIYVNNELDVLKDFLNKAVDLLLPGGRIVILSYHSLEDRIVKELFKYETLSCICPKEFPVCVCGKVKKLNILTRKPITASQEEINRNFRSRSVKLRAAEKV